MPSSRAIESDERYAMIEVISPMECEPRLLGGRTSARPVSSFLESPQNSPTKASANNGPDTVSVRTEPLDLFRKYMETYAYQQVFCHLKEQLIGNLERHWIERQQASPDAKAAENGAK
jgi:hypothetical protein